MTDVPFLIFSLEIFSLKIFYLKDKYDLKELKDFRANVLMIARSSSDFEDFKCKLKSYDCHKLYQLFLRYMNSLDEYYDYIIGKKVYIDFV